MLTRIHNFQGSFTFNGGYVSKVKDVESKPAILCPLYHLLNIQKIIMWIKVIKKKQFQSQTTYNIKFLKEMISIQNEANVNVFLAFIMPNYVM